MTETEINNAKALLKAASSNVDVVLEILVDNGLEARWVARELTDAKAILAQAPAMLDEVFEQVKNDAYAAENASPK